MRTFFHREKGTVFTQQIIKSTNFAMEGLVLKEKYIKVLKVNPMDYPKIAIIPNNLTTLNSIIGTGCIYPCRAESIIIAPHIAIIRAADGILLDLQGNRMAKDEIIAGTFLVVGIDDSGFIVSLSVSDTLKYTDRFQNLEIYTDKDVRESYWRRLEEYLNLIEEVV